MKRAARTDLRCRRFTLSMFVLSIALAAPAGAQNAAPGQPQIVNPAPVQPAGISVAGERAPAIAPAPKPVTRVVTEAARSAGAWTIAPVALSPIDVAALAAEDAPTASAAGVPLRIGINLPTPDGVITPLTHGEWRVEADGMRVWALELDAANAAGLRIHFSRFRLPEGARLLVVDDSGFTVESYEGGGLLEGQPFWGTICYGSRQLIEYQDPRGGVEVPEIEIDELSHIYRNLYDGGVARGGLLDCQKDVNCYLDPPESVSLIARDSVGRMTFSVPGGTALCTGALLNDVDTNTLAGWFLTANHCISTQATASTLQVVWFYDSDTCNGSVPNPNFLPRNNGATLLQTSALSDYTFMRLNADPDDGQGLAAWTTSLINSSMQLVGIHHPAGSWKRVSFGHSTTFGQICGGLPTTRFWYNDWDLGTDGQFKGITEGGSSGSPLFNPNWEVVGQLFGICSIADPTCNNPNQFNNVYGRFDQSFSLGNLGQYLNAITPDDAFEDNDSLVAAATLPTDVNNLILVDFDDYFRVDMCGAGTLTATATYSTSQMDLDMQLLNSGGGSITSATGSTSPKVVSSAVAAGTYYVRCYKNAGWGGNYTLTISRTYNCVASADVNADCAATPVDINRFVTILLGGGATPQELCRCDFSGNGAIDADDIGAYVADYVP